MSEQRTVARNSGKCQACSCSRLPMCQDTGIPIFSLEIGPKKNIDFNLKETLATVIQRATKQSLKETRS